MRKSDLPASAPWTTIPKSAMTSLVACRAPLLAWFDANARELPWRAPLAPASADASAAPLAKSALRSPYGVWVSEIMLQQTVVAAVIPHFIRWMTEFPNVRALADAAPERVLRAWAGLGYYARARNLHKGAQTVADLGSWPGSAAAWREIPGVGEYTAGAITSLALGLPAPILDGNVVRVFSRLLGLGFLPGAGAAEKRVYWDLARLWVGLGGESGAGLKGKAPGPGVAPPGEGAVARPGSLNEALMELGALVCTPASPRCGTCPLSARCAARRHGWTAILPPAKPRPKVAAVAAAAVVARPLTAGAGVLLETRPAGAFLAGHDMFPLFLGDDAAAWRAAFARRFPGWRLEAEARAATVRHTIMSTRYEVEVWRAALHPASKTSPPKKSPSQKFLAEGEVEESLTNALARKIWAAAER